MKVPIQLVLCCWTGEIMKSGLQMFLCSQSTSSWKDASLTYLEWRVRVALLGREFAWTVLFQVSFLGLLYSCLGKLTNSFGLQQVPVGWLCWQGPVGSTCREWKAAPDSCLCWRTRRQHPLPHHLLLSIFCANITCRFPTDRKYLEWVLPETRKHFSFPGVFM